LRSPHATRTNGTLTGTDRRATMELFLTQRDTAHKAPPMMSLPVGAGSHKTVSNSRTCSRRRLLITNSSASRTNAVQAGPRCATLDMSGVPDRTS